MPLNGGIAGGDPWLVSAAFNIVDVPILVVDAVGEPVLMNAAWRRAHGVHAGAVSWAELMLSRQVLAADGVTALAEDELPSRMALGGVGHQCEVVLEVAGVRRRWWVSAQPVFGPHGEVVAAVVRGSDSAMARPGPQVAEDGAHHLAAVADACRAVLRDTDARTAVCRAARTVCESVGASLWEPDHHGDLRATAADGPVPLGMRLPAGRASNAARAFATIRTLTADYVGPGSGVNAELIETVSTLAGQRIGAGIWVPVVANGRCLAVLVVGLSERSSSQERPSSSLKGYVPILEVLAAEAAIAIERQDLVARLQVEAGTDPLTGVANRRVWARELPERLQGAAASGVAMSLVIVDLDRFKDYNDRHGHPAGDALLQELAGLWQRRLRPGDLLCRIGGEEFAVLLPGCDAAAAWRVAEDLRSLVPRNQSVSAGLAQWDGVESCGTLMERADAALYAAKAAGRDQVRMAP